MPCLKGLGGGVAVGCLPGISGQQTSLFPFVLGLAWQGFPFSLAVSSEPDSGFSISGQ